MAIALETMLELALSVHQTERLAGARSDDVAQVEITLGGLDLRWPSLNANLYVLGP